MGEEGFLAEGSRPDPGRLASGRREADLGRNRVGFRSRRRRETRAAARDGRIARGCRDAGPDRGRFRNEASRAARAAGTAASSAVRLSFSPCREEGRGYAAQRIRDAFDIGLLLPEQELDLARAPPRGPR